MPDSKRQPEEIVTCPECLGTGEDTRSSACPVCHGDGVVRKATDPATAPRADAEDAAPPSRRGWDRYGR